MDMTVLDIILIACFIPAIWQGLSKGLINQVVGIAALFLGAWLAGKYGTAAGEVIARQFSDMQPKTAGTVGYIAVFFVSVLALGVLGKILTKIIKIATLGWTNRLLGLIFGIFKAALLLSLLVCLFDSVNDKIHLMKAETIDASKVYGYLRDFGSRFFPALKTLITNGNA